MRYFLLSWFLLFILVAPTQAQQTYQVTGQVNVCYTQQNDAEKSTPEMLIRLRAVDSNREYSTTIDQAGNFDFNQVQEGTYTLSTAALQFPDNDTLVTVNTDLQDLRFCIDKVYKPAPDKLIAEYQAKALADIKAGNPKILEWTALSLTDDPFLKLNPKIKKKYGFEYEIMSCVRPVTRDEIVQVKLWEAYNEVVYQHLDAQLGSGWMKNIKHERNKMRKQ